MKSRHPVGPARACMGDGGRSGWGNAIADRPAQLEQTPWSTSIRSAISSEAAPGNGEAQTAALGLAAGKKSPAKWGQTGLVGRWERVTAPSHPTGPSQCDALWTSPQKVPPVLGGGLEKAPPGGERGGAYRLAVLGHGDQPFMTEARALDGGVTADEAAQRVLGALRIRR